MVITIRKDVSRTSLLSLNVETTSTIADVKRDIDCMQSEKRCRSSKYDLYFKRNLLEEENLTLKDYGVVSHSTLQFSKKLHLHIKLVLYHSHERSISITDLSSTTVSTIKCRIIRTEQLPHQPTEFSLCFLGNKLRDTATLSDHNIQDGASLILTNHPTRHTVTYGSRGVTCNICLIIIIAGAVLCLPCTLAYYCVVLLHDHCSTHTRHHRNSESNEHPLGEAHDQSTKTSAGIII